MLAVKQKDASAVVEHAAELVLDLVLELAHSLNWGEHFNWGQTYWFVQDIAVLVEEGSAAETTTFWQSLPFDVSEEGFFSFYGYFGLLDCVFDVVVIHFALFFCHWFES